MKKRGYCANKSMVQQQSSPTKCMLNHGPQGLQNPTRHVPKLSKIEAWSLPGSQNVPKIYPRPTKRRPRAPKRRPRSGQGRPRGAPQHPRGAQGTPGKPPEPPKSEAGEAQNEFFAGFAQEVLRERLLEQFFPCFSACAQCLPCAKN